MPPEGCSACLEKAKPAERARIRAMTPAERMALALALHRLALTLAAVGAKLRGR